MKKSLLILLSSVCITTHTLVKEKAEERKSQILEERKKRISKAKKLISPEEIGTLRLYKGRGSYIYDDIDTFRILIEDFKGEKRIAAKQKVIELLRKAFEAEEFWEKKCYEYCSRLNLSRMELEALMNNYDEY